MQNNRATEVIERVYNVFSPFRERVGDYGVIVTGIAVVAGGFFVRTEVFAAILNVVGILGVIAGVAISGIGVFMLGNEKGWWGRTLEFSQSRGQGAPAQPPEYNPGLQAEAAVHEQPPPPGVVAPQYTEGVVGPQYPENPTVFNVAGPPEPAIPASPPRPHPSNFQASTAMLILGILPIALLLLSALPLTPWLSSEEGIGWSGRDSSDQLSIWGTIDLLRTDDRSGFLRIRVTYPWEVPFVAYLLSIAGTVAMAVILLRYRQPAPHSRPGDQQALVERADLFVASSILMCALTLSLLLFMWYEMQQLADAFGVSSNLSLGPTLCLLATFSLVGYLCVMIANPEFRSRFRKIDLSTFVSFEGRIARPTFTLIMVLMLLPQILTFLLLMYFDDVFIFYSGLSNWLPSGPPQYIAILIIGYADLLSIDWLEAIVSSLSTFIVFVLQLAVIWVWLAVCIKRYHDLNKSGWWTLLMLGLQAAIFAFSVYRNRIYDWAPIILEGPMPIVLVVVQSVLVVAVMWELMFKEGTRDVNLYGRQP